MGSADRRTTTNARLAVGGLLAGLVVVVLQFPWGGGVDTAPPTCFGMLGMWTVPCGGWPTVVAGAVTALIVWLVLVISEHPTLT
jgi:hypothetical protein